MERTRPHVSWQSGTGSLEWGEQAFIAAGRELRAETERDADTGPRDLHAGISFPIVPP